MARSRSVHAPLTRLIKRARLATESASLELRSSEDVVVLSTTMALIQALQAARDHQIHFLANNGVPTRDLVALTGLSQRRIQQLKAAPPPKIPRQPKQLPKPAAALPSAKDDTTDS